jgi:membrane protein
VVRSLEPYLPEGRRVIPAILEMVEEISARDGGRLYQILNEQILQPAESRRTGLLSFGLLAMLWASSRGFGILVKGVNRAYDAEEKKRGWVLRRVIGLGMTLALLLLLAGGVLVGLFGGQILADLVTRAGLSEPPGIVLEAARWMVALLFLSGGLAVVYYVAPAKRPPWRWTPPGSVAAVSTLLVLSFLLSLFLAQDFYGISWLTYSSFGFVLVVLLWMFLASLAVLMGAELNAVLDRQRGEGGTNESYGALGDGT